MLDAVNTVNAQYSEHHLQQHFVHYIESELDSNSEEYIIENVHCIKMFIMLSAGDT